MASWLKQPMSSASGPPLTVEDLRHELREVLHADLLTICRRMENSLRRVEQHVAAGSSTSLMSTHPAVRVQAGPSRPQRTTQRTRTSIRTDEYAMGPMNSIATTRFTLGPMQAKSYMVTQEVAADPDHASNTSRRSRPSVVVASGSRELQLGGPPMLNEESGEDEDTEEEDRVVQTNEHEEDPTGTSTGRVSTKLRRSRFQEGKQHTEWRLQSNSKSKSFTNSKYDLLDPPDGSVSQAFRLVQSPGFNYVVGFVIVVNALFIGFQADFMARNVTDDLPRIFRITEFGFCAFFTIEICLRVAGLRWRYIFAKGWQWNLFDVSILMIQVAEVSMDFSQNRVMGVLRVVRAVRLLRILRLVRVLRLVGELEMVVASIVGSLRSLAWTMMLLLMLTYILGVYLTQLVSALKISDHGSVEKYPELENFYGSLGQSMQALFEGITGGVDWRDLVVPLADSVSPWVSLFFMAYVSFALYCLGNVVTGVFCETAQRTVQDDKRRNVVHQLWMSLKSVAQAGVITESEFREFLDKPEMLPYLQDLDLQTEDARAIFHLFDINHAGELTEEDLLNGCVRLQGTARAIDLIIFMHDWRRHAVVVEESLEELLHTLAPKTSARHRAAEDDEEERGPVVAAVGTDAAFSGG